MLSIGEKVGLVCQADRLRGDTAQRDRGGEPRTLPAYGRSPLYGNSFIGGGWRTVLRIINNCNISLSSCRQASETVVGGIN